MLNHRTKVVKLFNIHDSSIYLFLSLFTFVIHDLYPLASCYLFNLTSKTHEMSESDLLTYWKLNTHAQMIKLAQMRENKKHDKK